MNAKNQPLEGKKVLIFVDNLFEDLELFYPKYRLIEEGAKVVVAGPRAKEIYKSKHDYPCQAESSFLDVKVENFDALIIPGGYAPDKIRRSQQALELVRQFNQKRKPIAFICHGGWVPISANILKGVKCTSAIAIKDDMVNAGAQWIDDAAVVDGNFISSRSPEDLPFFCRALIKVMVSL
jgi:deglycase